MNTYDIGDQVRLSVAFTDEDGHAADPTVITVKYADPTGAITTLVYDTDAAVGREETGAYYADLVPDRAGIWRYRWTGSGAITSAAEGSFTVRRSAF
jgi:hypothetical protein